MLVAVTPEPERSRERFFKTSQRAAMGLVAFGVGLVTILGFLFEVGLFGGGQDALAAAATKLHDAGSSRVHLTTTVRSGSDTVTVKAGGAVDFRAEIGRLELTDGSTFILRRPFMYAFGLTKKPVWCQYDLTKFGSGFLFGATTAFQSDPAAALVNLKENGSYEKIGTETLFGATAHHYSGHVELSKLIEKAENAFIKRQLRLVSKHNDGRLPLEVWLGSDDVVLRLGTSFVLPGEEGRTDVDATLDFSKYGIKVAARVPPRGVVAQQGEFGCPSLFD